MNKLLYKKPEGMTNAQLEKVKNICFNEIRKRQDKEKEKSLKQFVGKYYKYKNNYSCPEKESDYWWIYTYVKEFKDNNLILFSFQTDKYGKIIIKDNESFHSMIGYVESTSQEFYINLQNILDKSFLHENMNLDSDSYGQ